MLRVCHLTQNNPTSTLSIDDTFWPRQRRTEGEVQRRRCPSISSTDGRSLDSASEGAVCNASSGLCFEQTISPTSTKSGVLLFNVLVGGDVAARRAHEGQGAVVVHEHIVFVVPPPQKKMAENISRRHGGRRIEVRVAHSYPHSSIGTKDWACMASTDHALRNSPCKLQSDHAFLQYM